MTDFQDPIVNHQIINHKSVLWELCGAVDVGWGKTN